MREPIHHKARLKKKRFPVERPGDLKKVRLETFFFILAKLIFPTKQKKMWGKKNKLRPPNWPQLQAPAGPETDFFCGQPNGHGGLNMMFFHFLFDFNRHGVDAPPPFWKHPKFHIEAVFGVHNLVVQVLFF